MFKLFVVNKNKALTKLTNFLLPFNLHPVGSGLNDGQWHAVQLVAKENFAMLMTDGDEGSAVHSNLPLSITTGGTYHLGGRVYHYSISVFFSFRVAIII